MPTLAPPNPCADHRADAVCVRCCCQTCMAAPCACVPNDTVDPSVPAKHRDRVEQLQGYIDDARRETSVVRAELEALRRRVDEWAADGMTYDEAVAACEGPMVGGDTFANGFDAARITLVATLKEIP